jgi:hypothetical protein
MNLLSNHSSGQHQERTSIIQRSHKELLDHLKTITNGRL